MKKSLLLTSVSLLFVMVFTTTFATTGNSQDISSNRYFCDSLIKEGSDAFYINNGKVLWVYPDGPYIPYSVYEETLEGREVIHYQIDGDIYIDKNPITNGLHMAIYKNPYRQAQLVCYKLRNK
ncbi:MAG: hypothetical protein HQK51_16345 [Oligoflexia bacterium]|nr:hypothetical protein [Oligoflexia bacterium]